MYVENWIIQDYDFHSFKNKDNLLDFLQIRDQNRIYVDKRNATCIVKI